MKQALTIFLSGILFFSCGGEEEKPAADKQYTKEELTDLSVNMNSWDAKKQQDEIDQYIARHGWTMSQTKTGVYYMLLEEGKGDSAKVGHTAEVTYDISLLDGKLCYTSGDTLKTIRIGEDYVESGLHEGLQLMRVGDKMRFILPSHLANGLTGDQEKIGPRASVMYEIKLHSLK